MVLQTCNMRVADASPTPRRWTPERISMSNSAAGFVFDEHNDHTGLHT